MSGLDTWVVIPCFDEAERLQPNAYEAFWARSDRVGLVLVDDGSSDETLSLLERLVASHPERARVVALPENQGKAEAVRAGMAAALAESPRFVGYWDADLATPLDVIEEAAAIMDAEPNLQIVMGARVSLLGRRIERRALRHYLGRIFATGASLVLGLPVYDTQCGAKLFRVTPTTSRLFDRPFGSRWVFDVEILARYLEAGGAADEVYELPLTRWQDVGASKVRPGDFVRAVGELGSVFVRYPALRAREEREKRRLRAPRGR